MDFIDNINLVTAGVGRKKHLVLDLTDVVNTGVGGTINLNHIKAGTTGNFLAGRTLTAGLGSRPPLAVQRLGKDTGRGGFPTATGAGKQVGMGNLAGLNRILQGSRYKFLSHKTIKILGTAAGCRYFISHRLSIPEKMPFRKPRSYDTPPWQHATGTRGHEHEPFVHVQIAPPAP